MDNQHQRIFAVLLKIRRIEKDAVLLEAVRPFPSNVLGFTKRQRGDLVIEVRQPPRLVAGRGHVVKLGRLRRRAAGENDIAFWADKGVDPKKPRGTDLAKPVPLCGGGPRLEP